MRAGGCWLGVGRSFGLKGNGLRWVGAVTVRREKVDDSTQVHRGWDKPAPSGKNRLRLSQSTPARGIDWHPAQASPQAGLKSTDLGTGSSDAWLTPAWCRRARSHGAVNIANTNNAAKLTATTNISNSHSSTVESSSPSSLRPLPPSRPVIFFDPFARADSTTALQHARETCRFDPPPTPTSGSGHNDSSSSSVVDFERTSPRKIPFFFFPVQSLLLFTGVDKCAGCWHNVLRAASLLMEADEVMELYDSFWFELQIFKKQLVSSNPSNFKEHPNHEIEENASKPEF
ncbi:hypothetical protein DVH24_041545 [Malus domestica]|uniref:Uncharacterized protein n=1 Tax=Malus domestica TaxID=3750 RepID=A0A498I9G6_MALDO|nr:hypothetical protein DVH24_041545 [Malus domestica]